MYTIAVLKSRKGLRNKKNWSLKYASQCKKINHNNRNSILYKLPKTSFNFIKNIFTFRLSVLKASPRP